MLLYRRGLLFVLFIAVFASGSCGRIGIKLLPAPGPERRDAAVADSGAVSDSGGGGGAPLDAQTLDANSNDSGMPPQDSSVPMEDAGSCPTACENPHGTASCETGQCQTICSTSYSDCDGDPTNGCETNITSTAATCGSCTNACSNDHGTAACGAGLCTPTCQAGYADCDATPANGCETSLNTNANCGACGRSCANAHGTSSCSSGACMPVCAAGFADCDGDPNSGCESNIDTDPTHCGSCTNDCGSPNLICVSGSCQVSPCAVGRGECDGNIAVACETDTTTSVSNCGFCGNGCATSNGVPRCTASSCQVQSCNTNYANCDSSPANGCEVDLRANTNHCGSCGNGCVNAHGTTSCSASACAPSCSTGWGDCDTSRPNGCETALNTTSNCGMCGNACPAVSGGTPVCSSGICGATCNLTGTWALKITSPTTWPSDTYIRGGSGNHVFWLRVTSTQSGNSVAQSMIECGRTVPDFEASMVSETYGFALDASLFDHAPPYLPATSATLTLSGTSPGATLSQPLAAFLMGTTMSNPTTASWPSASTGLTQVDHDADGNPGVTVTYLNGGGYSYPRVSSSIFSSARGQNPYIASRLVFSLQGSWTSCTQASGPATVTQVNTRIFGCKLAGTTNKCSTGQWSFLDDNCLNYTVGSSTYTMVKVANGASCAAVRSALP